MTDRELLELAAKAAGYWSNEFSCVDRLPSPAWDPLGSDGDALRLAVKLRIDVLQLEKSQSAFANSSQVFFSDCTDSYAATRRAIVRAAAEIGRGK